MNKKYTKKQIQEAIAYWKKQIKCGNYQPLIKEEILNEAVGKNEADVARAVFNALNRSYGNIPGMLVHNDYSIEFNGNFYNKDNDYKSMPYKVPYLTKFEIDLLGNTKNIDSKLLYTETAGRQSALSIIKNNHLGIDQSKFSPSWAVFEIGKKLYAGDIAIVFSKSKPNYGMGWQSEDPQFISSVIEVKSYSLGKRIFNPSFDIVDTNGVYTLKPIGLYEDIWHDLMNYINDEISKPEYQEKISKFIMGKINKDDKKTLLYKFPLDVDFDDFVQRYANKNPFGKIEYIAMGYGDDLTFYKLCPKPLMNLYGTGQANRLAKRRAESINDVFNAAYLSLSFKNDRKNLTGIVDFSHNGALMVGDNDLAVQFR